MKTFVFVVCIVGLVVLVTADSKQEKVEKLKQIHDECQADAATKVDDDVMEKYSKGEAVDEATFSKHTLCMQVKMEVQKQNGDVNKEGLRKWFGSSDKVEEIVKECGERKGSTADEAALALSKCMRQFIPHEDHHHHHHHHD